jgi:hypothetical protein
MGKRIKVEKQEQAIVSFLWQFLLQRSKICVNKNPVVTSKSKVFKTSTFVIPKNYKWHKNYLIFRDFE